MLRFQILYRRRRLSALPVLVRLNKGACRQKTLKSFLVCWVALETTLGLLAPLPERHWPSFSRITADLPRTGSPTLYSWTYKTLRLQERKARVPNL